jgi:hypothetical protein
MTATNPFLCSARNPCRENPVTILGVRPGHSQAEITMYARSMEQILAAGEQPSDIHLAPGQCIAAAQLLQDPVLRLAFTLLSGGMTPEQEKL